MQLRLSLRFVVGLIPVFAGLIGCVDARFYDVPANIPWPDEWVAGRRSPGRTSIALAKKTIQWHLATKPDALVRSVDEILTPRSAVRHYRRVDYAWLTRNGERDEETIPIVEVKINATLLPATDPPEPVDASWSDAPFEEVMKSLTDRFGMTVGIAENVSVPEKITAVLKNTDPRIAFAEILLKCDLFFEPVVWAPREIRSYEYLSKSRFLKAIGEAAAEVEAAVPKNGSLTIVPFAQWLRDNPEPTRVIWQLDDKDRESPKRIAIGLSSEPKLAKKQLSRTLQDRIKLPPSKPGEHLDARR